MFFRLLEDWSGLFTVHGDRQFRNGDVLLEVVLSWRITPAKLHLFGGEVGARASPYTFDAWSATYLSALSLKRLTIASITDFSGADFNL